MTHPYAPGYSVGLGLVGWGRHSGRAYYITHHFIIGSPDTLINFSRVALILNRVILIS